MVWCATWWGPRGVLGGAAACSCVQAGLRQSRRESHAHLTSRRLTCPHTRAQRVRNTDGIHARFYFQYIFSELYCHKFFYRLKCKIFLKKILVKFKIWRVSGGCVRARVEVWRVQTRKRDAAFPRRCPPPPRSPTAPIRS